MEKKNQQVDKNFVIFTFFAGFFLIALLVGNAIGIAISHDDVTGFEDFYNALGGWEAIVRFAIALVLIVYSVRQIKKHKL